MIKFIEVSASAILWITAAVSFLPMPEAKANNQLTSLESIGSSTPEMIAKTTLFWAGGELKKGIASKSH